VPSLRRWELRPPISVCACWPCPEAPWTSVSVHSVIAERSAASECARGPGWPWHLCVALDDASRPWHPCVAPGEPALPSLATCRLHRTVTRPSPGSSSLCRTQKRGAPGIEWAWRLFHAHHEAGTHRPRPATALPGVPAVDRSCTCCFPLPEPCAILIASSAASPAHELVSPTSSPPPTLNPPPECVPVQVPPERC
jgi:hypothetical protein